MSRNIRVPFFLCPMFRVALPHCVLCGYYTTRRRFGSWVYFVNQWPGDGDDDDDNDVVVQTLKTIGNSTARQCLTFVSRHGAIAMGECGMGIGQGAGGKGRRGGGEGGIQTWGSRGWLALARVCAIFSVMCDRHCRQLQLHECLPPVLATRMVTTRNWKCTIWEWAKFTPGFADSVCIYIVHVGYLHVSPQNVLDQKRNLNTPSVSFWCLRNAFWTNIFSLCDNLKTKRCKSVQFEYIGGCDVPFTYVPLARFNGWTRRKENWLAMDEMCIVSFYQLKIELVSACCFECFAG